MCIVHRSVFSLDNKIITPSAAPNKMDMINEVLITIIGKCNSSPKDIFIFSSSKKSSVYNSLSVLPSSKTLVQIPINEKINPLKMRNFKRSVIVASFGDGVDRKNFFNSNYLPRICKNNYTMFVFNELTGSCEDAGLSLRLMMRFHANKGYFICFNRDNIPIIFIANPRDNDKLTYWTILPKASSSTEDITIQARSYLKDEICSEFSYNQIDQETKPHVDMKLIIENTREKMWNSSLKIEGKNETWFPYLKNIEELINVLNKTAIFYFESSNSQLDISVANSVEKQSFNIMKNNIVAGFATPPGKLSKYSGFWTLKSIIFLMTFIIICLLPILKRNIFRSALDALYLPINSGIFNQTNILSLKIFFTVMFLYCLIIYPTFREYLDKFPTALRSHNRVGFLKDLKDLQIKTIYTVVDTYDNFYHEPELNTKITLVESFSECFNSVYNNPDSVCIGPLSEIQKALENFQYSNKLQISKNKVMTVRKYQIYNKWFPLQGKFDWAIIALTKRKVYNRWMNKKRNRLVGTNEKEKTKSKTGYRPIRLEDLKIAFIFLIAGYSLATLCFLIEIKINRRYFKSRKSKNINIIKLTELIYMRQN